MKLSKTSTYILHWHEPRPYAVMWSCVRTRECHCVLSEQGANAVAEWMRRYPRNPFYVRLKYKDWCTINGVSFEDIVVGEYHVVVSRSIMLYADVIDWESEASVDNLYGRIQSDYKSRLRCVSLHTRKKPDRLRTYHILDLIPEREEEESLSEASEALLDLIRSNSPDFDELDWDIVYSSGHDTMSKMQLTHRLHLRDGADAGLNVAQYRERLMMRLRRRAKKHLTIEAK